MTHVIDATPEPAGGEPPIPGVPARRRWRVLLPLLAVIAITLVGSGAVFYGAWNADTAEPLDPASRRTLAAACDAAFPALRAFPPITSRSLIAQRAQRILDENRILARIPAVADTLTPPNSDGAAALRGWASDWRALLAARTRFSRDLAGPVARPELILPTVGGDAPITKRMTEYARTHALPQCQPDNLQAEIVDGGRRYPPQFGG